MCLLTFQVVMAGPFPHTLLQGDAADREKLRKKAREERKKKQKQMILDTVEDEVIEQFKSVRLRIQ